MIPSLAKDSSITLMTRLLVMAFAVASNVVVARALGPSLNGSYRIAILIVAVASLSITMGLGSANVYYGAREREALPELTGNSIFASLALGIAGAVTVQMVLFLPAFQRYLADNQVDVRWVRWLVLLLPLVQLRLYLVEIIRAQGGILRYNLIALWQAFVSLVGAVWLVWVLKQRLNGAFTAWAVSIVAAAVVTTWLAMTSTHARPRIDLSRLKASLSYGSRLHLGNIAQFLNYRLDLFIVGLFTDAAAVGLYATAVAVAEILWEIPHAIRTVLLYQVAAGDAPSAINVTARVSRVVTFAMGGICLALALASYPVISFLFGEAYLPAAPALIALIPGIWILSTGKLLATHLSGTGRPEVGTYGAILSFAATVILDISLIPRLGMLGAAIASSVSYALSSLLIFVMFARSTGKGLLDILVIQRDDITYLRSVVVRTLQKDRIAVTGPGTTSAQ